MRYPEKARAGEPAEYIPFYVPLWPRVAARGDSQSYRTPMRYPGKARAGEPAKSIPFTSLSGPASQRGVTRSHTALRCGIHEKIRQECPPNPFLLRPTLDPASQRGVTRSHTAPRCGIQKKLERESPQDTFPFASLSGPRVAARGDVLVIPHLDTVSTRYAVRWVEIERVAGCPRRTNRGRK